jgi:hypothetical protein
VLSSVAVAAGIGLFLLANRTTQHLTPEQIRPIVEAYREQMKLIQALASLGIFVHIRLKRNHKAASKRVFKGLEADMTARSFAPPHQ